MSITGTEISRVQRSKQEAKATYDALSRWYDLLEGWSETKSKNEGLRGLEVGAGERILEVGFGTGHGLVALARQVGEPGKVYGLDLSEGMLRVARQEVAKAGLLDRVDLRIGDAQAMPFGGGAFDALFMSFVLELFDTPQIPVVLQECRRVLRSGGRMAVVALSKEGEDGVMRRLYEWAHQQFPRVLDCRPIYVREALEVAGFQVLKAVERTIWGLPVEIVLARNP
jgi:demethylmenaquinone methyltransferase/2-methoxy-6-polyprenyl-1,4-benzoquinol methylase